LSDTDRLADEVERICAVSGAVIGFGFLHMESGIRLIVNEEVPFPMASTYKIAIAARLLKRIDEKSLSLDELVEILQDDLSPGGGIIKAHISFPGLILSIHNLISLAMTISDNTASDKILELAGGPDAVNDFLMQVGCRDMRIDRSTKKMITDVYGVTDRLPNQRWSHQVLLENDLTRMTGDPPEDSANKFLNDPRDSTTPKSMVILLEKLQSGSLLSVETTAALLKIMEQCASGNQRLRGLLPPGVAVTHKTGTIPKVCLNDVGMLHLPDGGYVIVAVFVRARTAEDFIGIEASETIIAQIARSAYDFAVYAC
tara:strand:+ start:363 stop:1304 length:942 start_codon:yes stop_codon:yes gene_type:complete